MTAQILPPLTPRVIRAAAMMVAAASLAAFVGCQHTTTYPSVPTSRGFAENPNTPAGEQAMVAAVQFVASRWSPGKREYVSADTPRGLPMVPYQMVVNLPMGTRKMFYERIPAQIGPGVQPATPESVASGLPVFHVSRVWLRFNSGMVDVLRPMEEIGAGAGGEPVYQKITVHVERDFGTQWRVKYPRTWNPGDDVAPPYFFVPAEDDANQFAKTMREQGVDIAKDPGLIMPGEEYARMESAPAPATAPEARGVELEEILGVPADAVTSEGSGDS
jgi:hypothetical protein